jgi:hypothetical protein
MARCRRTCGERRQNDRGQVLSARQNAARATSGFPPTPQTPAARGSGGLRINFRFNLN